MQVSVFTPSNNSKYLNEAYESLARQTLHEWEWVVLLNGGAVDWRPPVDDPRVVITVDSSVRGVGAAKRAACAKATGDILVELDHDDVLGSTCLEKTRDAFIAHPDAVFVYSDCAQIKADASRDDTTFNLAMGWEYDDQTLDGVTYLRCNSLAPTPHNVSYIWYAPNHLRAFRRDAYEAIGGFNPDLVVLDDQDLMMRMFEYGGFHHIKELLYLQRMHEANTQSDPDTNRYIQEQTVRYYQERIDAMAQAWSQRNGLAQIGLVTPTSATIGYEEPLQRVMVDPFNPRLPFPDSSVGRIVANDLLQRIPDRGALFNEMYRVLADGGILFTMTPSTDGRGAFQDPSHVAFYNENSFWYVTQEALRPSIPTLTARFQISHIRTFFPSEWQQVANIAYVQANLLAIKDGPRQGGPLLA